MSEVIEPATIDIRKEVMRHVLLIENLLPFRLEFRQPLYGLTPVLHGIESLRPHQGAVHASGRGSERKAVRHKQWCLPGCPTTASSRSRCSEARTTWQFVACCHSKGSNRTTLRVRNASLVRRFVFNVSCQVSRVPCHVQLSNDPITKCDIW